MKLSPPPLSGSFFDREPVRVPEDEVNERDDIDQYGLLEKTRVGNELSPCGNLE